MPNLVESSQVARIDLLRVALDGWTYWGEWSTVPGVTVATITGGEAQELLALVARLPDGEQARCFLPRYGLRVWGDDGILAETAICFSCNNGIVSTPDGNHDWFKFDSNSEPGELLLRALKRHDPESRAEQASG